MKDERADVAAILTELASRHLSPAGARQWLSMLRPAIWLTAASDADPVVAAQGGLAPIRAVDWPEFGGHLLPHLMTLDCEQLGPAAQSIDVPLPDVGTLSFFYWQYHADPAGQAHPPFGHQGVQRVVHQTQPVTAPDAAPEGLVVAYPKVALTGVLTMTAPSLAAFELHGVANPDRHGRLVDALSEEGFWVGRGPLHWVGGNPDSVQAPVEEVADRIRYDAVSQDRARRWRLLLQVYPDFGHEMPLGDETVFWLLEDGAKPEDSIAVSQGT